jgi:ATP-dependent DNA helicase RecQ
MQRVRQSERSIWLLADNSSLHGTLDGSYNVTMHSESEISEALRRYWGYDSFRPLQEKIVHSLLAGHDACVVMPTGGGKSLCYQLPAALLADRTVIVVSPLIALMQDQVAQLTQMGISAALLNSTILAGEQREIQRNAIAGTYRLLYLSPERLAREDTISWLKRVPVSFFAIDEAHCISEWGHEFRPDYRQMSALRKNFPERPIAAFTASATQQVRHDIMNQLALREPHRYIASFHRPNLRYFVRECSGSEQPELLARALKTYRGSNVIVYSPTTNRVEETVEFLKEQGIKAIGYHGKMTTEMRTRNQERWMSDEVPVLVGTLAFGLGINKAAVRAVIHLALPKSIEQFYQEAGRAGRDGLSADCVLLWRKRDVGLLAHFIGQLSDQREVNRAWDRYNTIKRFVESANCRHRQICQHFGENPKWKTCDACDVCGSSIDWLTARAPLTKPARRKKRGDSAPVAAGYTFTRGSRSATDKSWAAAGASSASSASSADRDDAQLVRESHGRWWGSAKKSSAVSASVVENRAAKVRYAGEPGADDVDPELREYLREWRRVTSKEMKTAAFIVMHDSSLNELCRVRPSSLEELRRVSGFGERKTELYGPQILEALARFRNGARANGET